MHILIVHQFYLNDDDPGGSRFNKLTEYWLELGHEVTVISGTLNYTTGTTNECYKGKYIYKEKPKRNLTVYRCYVSQSYNKNFFGRLFGYFSFTISSTITLFKAKRPDIIIVTSPPLFVALTGIIAKYKYRKPLVFEVRDLWPESAIDTGVLTNKYIIQLSYFIEKMGYKFADKINVLTPAFKEKLVKNKNVNLNKIMYIPNGADFDIFKKDDSGQEIISKYNLKDKFVITYSGAHGLANNLIALLKIANNIKDKDKKIHFLLIGDGMLKKELIKYKEENNIFNVTFIDAQPKRNMNAFINASDVCTAILQKNDTFKTVYPNKVFDYMSCKKPILIGIDGAARKLVEENNSGKYYDPEDIDTTTKIIMDFKNNVEKLSEMGDNGYVFVKKNFNRKKLAIRYIEEMDRLIVK
ncbi:glycosyltransferase WbuB [Macrococcoides goetzii]|uniref:Glycosyltransferase WbuB n=1 Tax=Macrococcoides goetzii TaxID=1891097 RepID=A0A395G792_9STAP|nr:glycosyltransferase family 4 protein [Macrococcus goetzii]RAI79921.1 glycosyltransferase WbuB [Macrococcus goetzii]